MLTVVEPAAPELLINWIQVGVGVASIIVAAVIALVVTHRQHRIQVLHQARMEVANVLSIHYRIMKTLSQVGYMYQRQEKPQWDLEDYQEAMKVVTAIDPLVDSLLNHAVGDGRKLSRCDG